MTGFLRILIVCSHCVHVALSRSADVHRIQTERRNGADCYRRAVVVGLVLGTAHVRSYRRRLVRKTPLANTSLSTCCGLIPA